MRPIGDKEMQAVDLDQLFEDYVETDLYEQLGSATTDPSSSDDLAHLFELPSSNGSDFSGRHSNLNRRTDAAWHKVVQRTQNPTPSTESAQSSAVYSSNGKTSSNDSDLLSFEDLFDNETNQLRSTSQPPTPRPVGTIKAIKKAVSFTERPVIRGVHKSLRKCTSSNFAKMMQPSHYRAPHPEAWNRRMDSAVDFNARGLVHGIQSPPPSNKLMQHEGSDGFFAHNPHPFGNTTRSPIADHGSDTPDMGFSNYQLTPQASPAIGMSANTSFSDNMGMSFASSTSGTTGSTLQTPPSSLRIPMTTWGPAGSPNMEFAFSGASEFPTTKTAGWWNEDAIPPAAACPTYRESNSRSTSQSMGASMAGLGISCDTASFGSYSDLSGVSMSEGMTGTPATSFEMAYGPVYAHPAQQPQHQQQSSQHQQHQHQHQQQHQQQQQQHQQHQQQPQQQQQQQHMIPIGHRPISRTPSPTPQPRFHRRRPSTHAQTHRTSISTPHTRRKSSTSSLASARQASSGGNVGFVNFTPDDSRKILTGVAPSGSSKTKARREKEAAEKRRKLSQAALKAVMEAGGDVDSLRRLEREGLLVLEN
jgi:hypothetical protein